MIYPRHLLAIAISVVLVGSSSAGEFNEKLSVGDRAPAWKDLQGVDGKPHSLTDLKKDVVVVVFTCNSCPFAVAYEDRIIALAKKYADKMQVAAINVNRIEEDSLPKMRERAAEKGFPFPYLFDPSQQIAKDFGANFTPEFFVLNKSRKVVYMGGMDDNSDPALVTERYVEPAIEAALSGGKVKTPEALARGCRIRYERRRRGK